MMKMNVLKLLIPGLIILSLTGCGDKKNNSIEISDKFKKLNVTFTLPDQGVSDIVVLCDTKTNLLYLDTYSHDGVCPFTRRELGHNGDMITVQYTLDDLKKEYPDKNINFYK